MSDKNNKTLKLGWRRVKFGDVVRLSKARSQDPLADGIERYIGLEHLEPGDLRIRSWGRVADGVTFTSMFQPGQVLFGKRRAYQRKVAVADFSGVCSGDIYVLETKDPQILLPELLPFICQTDAFFEHAVGTSAGSLSPRTNWTSLADFEFSLPSIAEQEKLLELFESSTSSIESLRIALSAAQKLLKRVHIDYVDSASGGISLALDDVLDQVIDYRGKSPNKSLSGVPLITARNVRDGFLDFSQPEFIPEAEFDSWMTRGIPSFGDVLFTTEAPLGNVARVPDMRFALAQRLVCLRAKPGVMLSDYLFWLMRSPTTQQRAQQRATGSTVAGIKQSELRKISVVVPPLHYQQDCIENLNAIEDACRSIEKKLVEAIRLQQLMMGEFL
ncbi:MULTISPECIES: restriction endonuclease subunit S [Pseudomonas putida group]|uniref:Restriction modification system, type I n=1 Tax=Pseudomonas putida (strain DOT-T1E) TaxID=1196325 RepID=I7B5F5_PSEPT|nr:restriction endonuclease subunit S [Pseudomonas putida]AFO46533.1 restriction modification system, type I [Pseudomonas putida DOT-T1E]ULL03450.1 restriction endonuclease subunit S [Pseudomonas putida]UZM92615.1 restriction endonuclease subunit S [Pseudomonas putida DOT-T1E]